MIFAVIKHPMKVIFMKPKIAALSILRGVFADTEYGTWIGPRWFNVWGLPKKQTLRTCPGDERQKIAQVAEEVYRQCVKTAEDAK